MKTKLAALIEVRKIVTLMFAIVFAFLAVTGKLSAESVLSILTMVFGFYFAKSSINEKGDG